MMNGELIQPPSHPTYDLKGIIKLALQEDSGDRGDVTSLATVPSNLQTEAHFLAEENGVVAILWRLIRHSRWSGLKRTETMFIKDPSWAKKRAQNCRCRKSCTQLYAENERHSNLNQAGGVKNALKSVDSYLQERNLQMKVEIETRTLEEVKEIIVYATQQANSSLTRIMLDNMVVPHPNGDIDVLMLKEAVALIDGRFETEASGNVTIDTVHKIGQTGVTIISSGALTYSVKALDISLKIDAELALEVGRRTNRA